MLKIFKKIMLFFRKKRKLLPSGDNNLVVIGKNENVENVNIDFFEIDENAYLENMYTLVSKNLGISKDDLIESVKITDVYDSQIKFTNYESALTTIHNYIIEKAPDYSEFIEKRIELESIKQKLIELNNELENEINNN